MKGFFVMLRIVLKFVASFGFCYSVNVDFGNYETSLVQFLIILL